MSHKRQYTNFIDPQRREVEQVNVAAIRRQFQELSDHLLDAVPDDGEPADKYMYASHMGEFVRVLDHASDCYVKALMAFYADRRTNVESSE